MDSLLLRKMPLGLRISLSALILVLLGGYAASGLHMAEHHGPRDGQEGLTGDDITGVYHGVQSPSPLRSALEAGHPDDLDGAVQVPAAEREALLAWLNSGRVIEDWDNFDLGEMVPADLLDANCMACHGRGATNPIEPPLEYLDDIRVLAFDNNVSPTDEAILLASTHAHALSLFVIALATVLLLCLTRFRRSWVSAVSLAISVGLLLDLVSWWLARDSAIWVNGILLGGTAHALGIGLAGVMVLADLWLPANDKD